MPSLVSVVLPPLDGTILLPDCVDFNTRHNPRLPVYVFASDDDGTQTTEITYLEYGRAADRAALILHRNLGSIVGRTVAILAMADTLVYQTVVMGCLRAGLVPFPISPRLPASSIAHLLRSSGCTHLLVTKSSLGGLIRDVSGAYANLISDTELFIEELPLLNDVYPRLGSETSDDPFLPHTDYTSPNLADNAFFLHSSGSTGLPKAIAISHEVFIKRLSFPDTTELRGHTPDIRFAGMALPPFHQLGLAVQVFNLMYTVKSVALYPPIVSATNPWPMVPTTENVISHAKITGANAIATVPSYIEVWAQSRDDVEFLSQMEFVAFAGGALPSSVGNQLVQAGVKLSSMYGSTEVGGPTHLIPRDTPSDWEWLRFGESIDIRWVESGDGLFELQFLTSQKHRYAVENLPDVRGYSTSDLWRKHPTKIGLWKFTGRLDDVITLSTGEKAIPVPMENQLTESEYIRGAVLFGQQQHQLGLLVEPEVEVQDSMDFVEKIWPAVDRANKSVPAFARIFKDMIIVADRAKQFIRSPKGTIVRKPTITMYSDEIERLYSTSQGAQGGLAVPKSLEVSELIEWLTANLVELVPTSLIDTNQDLFQQGVDSVIAILLRNRIIRMLSHFDRAPVSLQLNVVANHPTIYRLATHIAASTTISTTAAAPSSDAGVEAMINAYSPSRRINLERKLDSSIPVILLTGSTGSLGSHILSILIKDPTVGRVYALNRPSKTPAIDRQLTSFEVHGLDASIPDGKVIFLDSPYQDHQLGLSDVYEEIRRTCTLIIHNGWMLDFNLSLDSFAENIKATGELVKLGTSTTYNSRFIFVSSVTAAFCEPATKSESVRTGYGESKYVAEQLIARSGLDFVSLRFGQLCGGRATGAWSTKEWFPLVIKTSLSLGCLPESLGVVRWLPVDIAASVVCSTSWNQATSQIISIEHPRPLSGTMLMEHIRSSLARQQGIEIRTVPLSEWIDKIEKRLLVASHEDIAEMPVLKILQFMRAVLNQADETVSTHGQKSIGDELDKLLSTINFITEEDVGAWIGYWKRLGFI